MLINDRQMRFQAIQILRFFCAMGVVLYHSIAQVREHQAPGWSEVPWSQLANIGVLFFFAISGFVLTHALKKESVGRYLLLRVLRIYPPFFLAILLISAFRFAYGSLGQLPELPLTYLLLIPGAPGPSGYVLGGIEWTLKHEVFYYVLLALLWLVRSENFVKIALGIWAGAIIAFTVHAPGAATQAFPDPKYFVFSSTHLALIGGAFSYFYRDRIRLTYGAFTAAMILLFGAYEFFLHTEAKYACVTLAAVLLLARLSQLHLDESRPVLRTLIAFGDGSYGLYLLHMSVLLIIVANLAYQQYPAWFSVLVSLVVATTAGLVFGTLEYRWYRWIQRTLPSQRRVAMVAAPSAGVES